MSSQDIPKIIKAEKLLGGAVVTFGDGVSVLFSAQLLLEALAHSRRPTRPASLPLEEKRQLH